MIREVALPAARATVAARATWDDLAVPESRTLRGERMKDHRKAGSMNRAIR
jgi:hypothetical protein